MWHSFMKKKAFEIEHISDDISAIKIAFEKNGEQNIALIRVFIR